MLRTMVMVVSFGKYDFFWGCVCLSVDLATAGSKSVL